ncbi:NF038122 family metalloprotease [Sphingomonas sp. Tas61C01]|uniref:NF038122 family metalloprotease n=1 Tax=Sphingomonas sp. Tas61C01 TaxID=3458297 RepID=UPI00403ECA38
MIGLASKSWSSVSAVSLSVVSLSATAVPADALVINNYFSKTLTANPRATEIIAAINYSSNAFASLLSNDVTVNIRYDLDLDAYNFLGVSGASGDGKYKETYVDMLRENAAAHPENVVLSEAVKYLEKGNYGNPDLSYVGASSALLRANGFDTMGDFERYTNDDGTPVYDLYGAQLDGGLDGVISLASIDEMLFGFDIPEWDGTEARLYSAINTIQHEIMHVLGGGNSNVGSDYMMQALDMYRYAAPGTPEFTEDGSAYFSIDGGVTKIQQFSRTGTDRNGWGPDAPCSTGAGSGGPIGLFMDSTSCPNQPTVTFSLASPEGIQLMALGWNPRVAAVPEPATWSMMLVGFAGVGAALRRRRTVAEVAAGGG